MTLRKWKTDSTFWVVFVFCLFCVVFFLCIFFLLSFFFFFLICCDFSPYVRVNYFFLKFLNYVFFSFFLFFFLFSFVLFLAGKMPYGRQRCNNLLFVRKIRCEIKVTAFKTLQTYCFLSGWLI